MGTDSGFPHFMRAKLSHWLLPLLLIAGASACDARTFKVVDSVTDLPIAGADAIVVAYGKLPGIGHPIEFKLREWNAVSDQNGEFSISPPYADRAWVFSFGKRGYGWIDTVKEYRHHRTPGANPDVLFLTRSEDKTFEYIRYLAYLAAEAVDSGQGLAGMRPVANVATLYGQAKGKARTARELGLLREFCRFSGLMQAQAAAGWPDIAGPPDVRKAGQELIDDCHVR
jgi:hypothetical protein